MCRVKKSSGCRANYPGQVSIIDLVKKHISADLTFLPPGSREGDVTPVGMTMNRDGKTAFVTLGRANSVAFVDTATRKIKSYVPGRPSQEASSAPTSRRFMSQMGPATICRSLTCRAARRSRRSASVARRTRSKPIIEKAGPLTLDLMLAPAASPEPSFHTLPQALTPPMTVLSDGHAVRLTSAARDADEGGYRAGNLNRSLQLLGNPERHFLAGGNLDPRVPWPDCGPSAPGSILNLKDAQAGDAERGRRSSEARSSGRPSHWPWPEPASAIFRDHPQAARKSFSACAFSTVPLMALYKPRQRFFAALLAPPKLRISCLELRSPSLWPLQRLLLPWDTLLNCRQILRS